MSKKRARPLPRPTKKLYRHFDFSFYHDGVTRRKPKPVDATFAYLFLDPEEGCLIRVRSNLRIDKIAKMMRGGHHVVPMCDGAMNYARIWNRRATYLCDESGGGNPNDHKTWVWYKIDNTVSGNKVIRKLDPTRPKEHLTFSEADKIISDRKFEFDGSFADLLVVLQREGFQII